MKTAISIILFVYMSLSTLSTTNYNLKTELQDVPPKFYSLPNGKISGISFDIMELIGKSSKYRFNYEKKLIPISRIIVNLEKKKDNKIDMILKNIEFKKDLWKY